MTEHQAGNEDERFVEALRQRAAAWQAMADHLSAAARNEPPPETLTDPLLRQLGFPELAATLMQRMEAIAQRARLSGDVEAAHAIACQEMLEAGGPDNPEAYRKYQEATELHIALLPGADAPHEPGGRRID